MAARSPSRYNPPPKRSRMNYHRRAWVAPLLLLVAAPALVAQETGQLADHLRPYLNLLDGSTPQFTLTADAQFQTGKDVQKAKVTLSKIGGQSFSLTLDHPQ